MYRPEGWENRYKNFCSTDSRLLSEVYEEGANAILEGLMKITFVKAGEVLELRPSDTFESNVPGHLVFIPRD